MEESPENSMFRIGCEKYNAGQDAEAIRYFDEAIRINPKHAQALFYRGDAKKRWSSYLSEDADRDYDRAEALESRPPMLPQAHFPPQEPRNASSMWASPSSSFGSASVGVGYQREFGSQRILSSEAPLPPYQGNVALNPGDSQFESPPRAGTTQKRRTPSSVPPRASLPSEVQDRRIVHVPAHRRSQSLEPTPAKMPRQTDAGSQGPFPFEAPTPPAETFAFQAPPLAYCHGADKRGEKRRSFGGK